MPQPARVFQINTSKGGVPKHPVTMADVTTLGLAGDEHVASVHGGPQRALCLYSLEQIQALQAEGHPIYPGATGENLTLAGVDWTAITPGVRLRLGATVLIEVTQYTEPCPKIASAFANGEIQRMAQDRHPGWSRVYAKVLETGTLRTGDTVTVLPGSEGTREHIALWPSAPPKSAPEDDFEPWLEPYLLTTDRPLGAVLVCPGGGYAARAPHEQAPIARYYNQCGYHAFVLQYRVAPHRHPAPLLDASRALRLIRHHAQAWCVDADHIAVCGFSAGGHLAASLGVHYDLTDLNIGDALDAISARPDALLLSYPVISASRYRHRGSFESLLGPEATPEALDFMSLELQVNERTPPAFLWHTADDASVPVENSLVFAEMLHRHGVPFELHIFPSGTHGLGLAADDPHVGVWPALSQQWLASLGWPGAH